MNHTVLYLVLLAWVLWSLVRDLLPLFALKDMKSYILPTLAGALLPLTALVLLILPAFNGGSYAYTWSVAWGFLIGTVVLEGAMALIKKERKQVSGRSGLKMPYRAPISFVLALIMAFYMPDNVQYGLVSVLVLVGLVGIWGKNKLRSAVYWTTDELKKEKTV